MLCPAGELVEREPEIWRYPAAPALPGTEVAQGVAGRYAQAARNEQGRPAAARGEGDSRGPPLNERDGPAGRQVGREGDGAYLLAGAAGHIELPEVHGFRGVAAKNLGDRRGGQKNLGCDRVAQAF